MIWTALYSHNPYNSIVNTRNHSIVHVFNHLNALTRIINNFKKYFVVYDNKSLYVGIPLEVQM